MISWHRFYDPENGRYITADPIGLVGGVNLYSYVEGDPVNWIDPWGNIKWSGSVFQTSATAPVGATFARFKLESECINGRKAIIKVWAVGPSGALGVKATATWGSTSFEDYSTNIDPSKFNGIFLAAQAGITFHPGIPIRPPGVSILPGTGPGLGPGLSDIRLGDAFSDSPLSIGTTYGYDRSISGTIGSSTVMDTKYVNCCP